jgi:hypothetical protein
VRKDQARDTYTKQGDKDVSNRPSSLRLGNLNAIKSFESYEILYETMQVKDKSAEQERDAQQLAASDARRIGGGRFDSDEDEETAAGDRAKKRRKKNAGAGASATNLRVSLV